MHGYERTDDDERLTVTSYARLASGPCPPAADLLLALGAALGPTDGAGALEQLDDDARALFDVASLAPAIAAERLVALLVGTLGFRTTRHGSSSCWLLDRVVRERRGHPALIAVVGQELARRAGINADVLSAVDGWYVSVGEQSQVVLVTLDGATAMGAAGSVRRRCAHELAYVVLTGLEAAYRREGESAPARRAAGLRRLLPVARQR